VERAGSDTGWQDYLSDKLAAGELETAIAASRRDRAAREALLVLAADLDTPFAVRIGVGAIFEDLGPEGLLADLIQPIVDTLVGSEHAQVRADAAHFLGLSGSEQAREPLRRLREDADAEVREIAQDSLRLLGS
jgi:HEAT repeat protein